MASRPRSLSRPAPSMTKSLVLPIMIMVAWRWELSWCTTTINVHRAGNMCTTLHKTVNSGWWVELECCCTSTQNGTNMCSVAPSSSRLMTLKPKYGRPRLPPPMHPLPPCHRGKGNVECALSNNAPRHSRHFFSAKLQFDTLNTSNRGWD